MPAPQLPPRVARRRTAGTTRVLAALVTAWAVFGHPLAAQTIPAGTIAPKRIQVMVLEANADARVQGGSPSTNFPTGDLWLGLPDKTAFIHFNLGSVPAGAAIVEADLLVTFRDTYTEQGSNQIEVGSVEAGWAESQVTFSSQPSIHWTGRTRTVSSPGTVSFDVKPALDAWLAGRHPNNGVALRGNGPLKNAFSREAPSTTDRPRLRIRYVVP